MTEEASITDKIMAFWEADSKLDRYNLSGEAVNISKLHYKYLNLMKQTNAQLAKLKRRKDKMFLEKSLFYNGKGDPDEYREKNFHLKVQKSDLDVYIKADDDYAKVLEKISEYESLKELLTSILWMIRDRKDHIKSAIEWDRFTSGNG